MKKIIVVPFICLIACTAFLGCEKKTETIASSSLSDYYPLQVGKAYIYRLDSTILAPHNTALLVNSYLAKDTIESVFTDNEGRQTYRIFRFIKDTAGIEPWRFSATYTAVTSNNRLEYVDNNLRFIKLIFPIFPGATFKGNSYIETKSSFQYLDGWDYEYQNIDQPYTVGNVTFDSTITVLQHDETTPEGPFNPEVYQQRNFSIEVYAKHVGLIYKEFLHTTWQGTLEPPHYDDDAFGVKLSLVSY